MRLSLVKFNYIFHFTLIRFTSFLLNLLRPNERKASNLISGRKNGEICVKKISDFSKENIDEIIRYSWVTLFGAYCLRKIHEDLSNEVLELTSDKYRADIELMERFLSLFIGHDAANRRKSRIEQSQNHKLNTFYLTT